MAIGQFDLSVSMGLAGQYDHPDVIERQSAMVRQAREKGVEVLGVVFDTEPDLAKNNVERWKGLDARMIAVSGDRFALVSAYQHLGRKLGFAPR